MYNIHRTSFQGPHISKGNQEGLDGYDRLMAYFINYSASSGYAFCALGENVSRVLTAWDTLHGHEKARKKVLIVNDIMLSEDSFTSFRKWFHQEYVPQYLAMYPSVRATCSMQGSEDERKAESANGCTE